MSPKTTPPTLRSTLEGLKGDANAVIKVIAQAGFEFDLQAHERLRDALAEYPPLDLFRKCIIETARWGGFVEDPSWPSGATEFLATESPRITERYFQGYHRNSNPIDYLSTWRRIFDNPSLPEPPHETTSLHEVVDFLGLAEATLHSLAWERQRSWLGAWTFFGAFKIFLLHERRLWSEPLLNSITMPMGGGKSHQSSFEGGWRYLTDLGILEPLPPRQKKVPKQLQKTFRFREEMALTNQAHAGVASIASRVHSSALHINSGLYLLGSE